MWYRIELNKDRSVRTCVEVSGSINEGRSVHYVEADSKASAIAILVNRYHAYMKKEAARKAMKSASNASKGMCRRCTLQAEPGLSTCRKHTALRLQNDRRKRSGEAVKPRRLTDQQKAARMAARAAAQVNRQSAHRAKLIETGTTRWARTRGQIEYNIYAETLEAFETMTPSRFRGWLVAKIAECQDKIDGKKSIADHFPQAAE